ncbi:MAG: hypothetical protein O7G85_11540 [Planctomycetota bacterium]|nr:hypothetical protein [Planctomycetota bacterium]
MAYGAPFMLASSGGTSLFGDLLPLLLGMVVIVVVGFVIVMYIRRSFYADQQNTNPGFTLHDLRNLHKSGQLNDEEFEKAKVVMIGRVQASRIDPKTENKPKKPGNGTKSETDDR